MMFKFTDKFIRFKCHYQAVAKCLGFLRKSRWPKWKISKHPPTRTLFFIPSINDRERSLSEIILELFIASLYNKDMLRHVSEIVRSDERILIVGKKVPQLMSLLSARLEQYDVAIQKADALPPSYTRFQRIFSLLQSRPRIFTFHLQLKSLLSSLNRTVRSFQFLLRKKI